MSNNDNERLACLKIRNHLDRKTYSDKNKSDGEKPPTVLKPSDSLPDAVRNVDA